MAQVGVGLIGVHPHGLPLEGGVKLAEKRLVGDGETHGLHLTQTVDDGEAVAHTLIIRRVDILDVEGMTHAAHKLRDGVAVRLEPALKLRLEIHGHGGGESGGARVGLSRRQFYRLLLSSPGRTARNEHQDCRNEN